MRKRKRHALVSVLLRWVLLAFAVWLGFFVAYLVVRYEVIERLALLIWRSARIS